MSLNENTIMFNNIYYNNKSSTIHLWETINGKRIYNTYQFEHNYYSEDFSKKSPIKDIYGVPMIAKKASRKRDVTHVVETGIKCAESDIAEDIRFLHRRYEKVPLTTDVSVLNICYLDIEVAVGKSKYPDNHRVKIRKKFKNKG